MLPSNSSALSCQVTQNMADINDILERITPIEFIPNPLTEQLMTASLGTLTIQSDVQALDMEVSNFIASEVYADTLTSPTITSSTISANTITSSTISCTTTNIGNTTITSSGSTLQLPANTTIGGQPVSGAPIQYIFWNPVSGNLASNYIYNAASTGTTQSRQPFILPVNGTLRSFAATISLTSGVINTYPITNFTLSLYADNIIVGSATIVSISGAGTLSLANNSLNYSAIAGQALSLQYTIGGGSIGSNPSNFARASVGWIPS